MTRFARFALLATGATALASCATYDSAVERNAFASALVSFADGTQAGTATLAREGDVALLRLDLSNLPGSDHAVHLHETGSCVAPDFTSAGGHLNPANRQHGFLDPRGAHMGDLPNLKPENGRVDVTVPVRYPADDVEAALADADGTALIIHAGPDDYRTDPAGAAGSRVACGVFIAM